MFSLGYTDVLEDWHQKGDKEFFVKLMGDIQTLDDISPLISEELNKIDKYVDPRTKEPTTLEVISNEIISGIKYFQDILRSDKYKSLMNTLMIQVNRQ